LTLRRFVQFWRLQNKKLEPIGGFSAQGTTKIRSMGWVTPTRFWTGGRDKMIHLWDIVDWNSAKVKHVLSMKGHSKGIFGVDIVFGFMISGCA
jgi:hypothetical protein